MNKITEFYLERQILVLTDKELTNEEKLVGLYIINCLQLLWEVEKKHIYEFDETNIEFCSKNLNINVDVIKHSLFKLEERNLISRCSICLYPHGIKTFLSFPYFSEVDDIYK